MYKVRYCKCTRWQCKCKCIRWNTVQDTGPCTVNVHGPVTSSTGQHWLWSSLMKYTCFPRGYFHFQDSARAKLSVWNTVRNYARKHSHDSRTAKQSITHTKTRTHYWHILSSLCFKVTRKMIFQVSVGYGYVCTPKDTCTWKKMLVLALLKWSSLFKLCFSPQRRSKK